MLGALALVPAALVAWLARRTRAATPAGRPRRSVWVIWVASVGLLAVGPPLGLYAYWTTTGALAAPATGQVGLRVAGWLTVAGLAAFFLVLLALVAEALLERSALRPPP